MKAQTLLVQDLGQAASLVGGEGVPALMQGGGDSAYCRRRCPQLVRGERDEVRLELTRELKVVVGDRLLEKRGDDGAERREEHAVRRSQSQGTPSAIRQE